MKHHSFLMLMFMLCPLSAFSQVNFTGEEMAVGLRAGATMSTMSFSPTVTQQQLIGIEAGGVFRYIGEKHLGIQIEANFTQRGWREQNDSTAFSRQLNYIQVPLLSHFFFGAKSFRWIINLGPTIGILLSDDASGTVNAAQHVEPVSSRFDYGITAGTGFEINTRRAGIYQLEARYNFGLGDVFSNRATDNFRRSSNRNIVVTLGVLFNLK